MVEVVVMVFFYWRLFDSWYMTFDIHKYRSTFHANKIFGVWPDMFDQRPGVLRHLNFHGSPIKFVLLISLTPQFA